MKSKSLLSFFSTACLLLFGFSLSAQAPGYLWAKNAIGASQDYVYCTATDGSGSVVTAGTYISSSINFGGSPLINAGAWDIFIVKYNAAGSVTWKKTIGGAGAEEADAICTDAGGNIYVTGFFSTSTLNFGSFPLTNTGGRSAFLVKYNPAGTVLWAKAIGGTGSASCYGGGISVDAGGNVSVIGNFANSAIYIGTDTLTYTGVGDMFVAKYDASGNVLWAKSAAGTLYDEGRSIATDAGGNIFITGSFQSPTLVFDNDTITNSATYSDIFILKYDPAGNVLWTKSAAGTASDVVRDICLDPSGNVLITGYYLSPSMTFGTTTITNMGSSDLFVAKYDSSGNLLWVKSKGGSGEEIANSIATDAFGHIFIAGFFASPSLTFASATLATNGFADMLVLAYDDSGNPIWAKSAGDAYWDYGQEICTDNGGNVFVGGAFNSVSIAFGATTFINTDPAGGNTYDMFLLKLNSTTGVPEMTAENTNATVYPNPTNGQLYVTSEAAVSKIEVLDVLGKKICSKEISSSSLPFSMEIDLSGQPAGIYFVQLQTTAGCICKKISINR